MFGSKKPSVPRPLNDSGRSLISETFSLEGTLRTSGAIDIAGLIKGAVYTNDLIIKESGSIIGPVETDKIEIKPAMIQLMDDIKSLGEFRVNINLHSDVQAEIKINVLPAEVIQ